MLGASVLRVEASLITQASAATRVVGEIIGFRGWFAKRIIGATVFFSRWGRALVIRLAPW